MVRRKNIDESKILSASWDVIEAQGFNDFSMRKLATELDIKASSLYNHFESKQAIFQKLADQLAKEILNTIEDKKQWDKQLFEIGKKYRACLNRYPYSGQVMLKALPFEVHFLELMSRILKTIDFDEISNANKFSALNCFMNYIIAFVNDTYEKKANLQYLNSDDSLTHQMLSKVNHLEEKNQQLIKKVIIDLKSDEDKEFEYGLKILINGIKEDVERKNIYN